MIRFSEHLRIARVVGEYEPDRGGVARTVSTLSHELARRACETVVYSLGPAAASDGVEVVALPRSMGGARSLWRALCRGGFDIVHSHVYSSFVPGTALPGAALSGAKRVMTTHFHVVGSGPTAARAAFDRSVGRATVRASHQVQVDTRVERDAIATQFKLAPERLAVVPPPLAPFLQGLPPAPTRDFGGDPFRLLFVGRLDPQKGLGTILDALAALDREGAARFHLTVVGRDYKGVQAGYEAKARALRRTQVEFKGSVTDGELLALYDSSHALLLASRYEAFGIVFIEAFSRGLPVIATRVGGIPEVVEDGETGLLVPYGDTGALTDAVRRLATDPALASRLSRAGPGAVEAFAPSRVADLELAAYRKVLGAG